MSVYQVTREGQELGSFDASQIEEGLKSGQFLPSDWGWREGMSGWQGLTEIFGSSPVPQTKAPLSSLSALVRRPSASNPTDSLNPYAAPSSNVIMVAGGTNGTVPFAVIEELTNTRSWVRTIAIILWISFSLQTLGFLVMGGLALLGLISKSGIGPVGGPEIVILFVFYGIFGALTYYPAKKLSKYAADIASLGQSQSFTDLTAALAEQRRVWKFTATLLIIYLAIMLVIFVGSTLVSFVR
ncbi:MAG: DUF4339 domain-containing protein [Verrucomicrobia bacterium]|nr:DUF4339 domain-containing protein [Verrucomicrobiota bacterium]